MAPQAVDSGRAKALLGFIGSYVFVVMRPTRVERPAGAAHNEEEDDEGESEQKAFMGILASTDTTVITLVAASRVHPASRHVVSHMKPSFVHDAFPLVVSLRIANLQRVAKMKETTMAALIRDPLRATQGVSFEAALRAAGGTGDIRQNAGTVLLLRVLVRRYAATHLLERVLIEEGQDPVLQLDAAVSEAVGGVPPNSQELAGRIRMPLAEGVATAVKELTTVVLTGAAAAGTSTSSRTVEDKTPVGALLRRIPAALAQTKCSELREWLVEDATAFRMHFRPRRQSPSSQLVAVTDRYVKRCFVATILSAIVNCILGGIMLGAVIAGPVTSTLTLETDFSGFMWYLLIPPGLLMAIFGIFQSARADAAAVPASFAAKMWRLAEIIILVVLFPGFVFGCWFVSARDTPRATYSTPGAFWRSNANTSTKLLCTFMTDRSCSGWDSVCFAPLTTTTYVRYIRDDCPANCVLPLKFLTNLPTATCKAPFLASVDSGANLLLGFFVAFAIVVLLRNASLLAIRRYYTRQARRVFEDSATEHQEAQQQQGGAGAAAS